MIPFSLLVTQIPPKPAYRHVTNVRFAYAINVPTFLIAGREPDNGDGRTFFSVKPKIRLVVYGGNVLDEPAGSFLGNAYKTRLHEALEKGGKPALKLRKQGFFALSWLQAERVIYTKLMTLPNQTYAAFELEYPAKEKLRMSPVVTRISSSFRAVERR